MALVTELEEGEDKSGREVQQNVDNIGRLASVVSGSTTYLKRAAPELTITKRNATDLL